MGLIVFILMLCLTIGCFKLAIQASVPPTPPKPPKISETTIANNDCFARYHAICDEFFDKYGYQREVYSKFGDVFMKCTRYILKDDVDAYYAYIETHPYKQVIDEYEHFLNLKK